MELSFCYNNELRAKIDWALSQLLFPGNRPIMARKGPQLEHDLAFFNQKLCKWSKAQMIKRDSFRVKIAYLERFWKKNQEKWVKSQRLFAGSKLIPCWVKIESKLRQNWVITEAMLSLCWVPTCSMLRLWLVNAESIHSPCWDFYWVYAESIHIPCWFLLSRCWVCS